MSERDIHLAIRESYGQVLAILVKALRDFDLAEDALQSATLAALKTWPSQGIPKSPKAWLIKSAKRKFIDGHRHRRVKERHAREEELFSRSYIDDEEIPDERLRLLFTCAHPALERDKQVALTLRTVGGLSTSEVARALLVKESTLQQRLVRAKKKIKFANIPYVVPEGDALVERSEGVLDVIYLIFNEGWHPAQGTQDARVDLVHEALRMGEAFVHLLPNIAEAFGLLSLMWLHESRRQTRRSEGAYVPLLEQERSKWSAPAIKRGLSALKRATLLHAPGPYQIQATISAAHAEAKHADETDWKTIAELYRILIDMTSSDVVRLNHAVAIAYALGPKNALELLLPLERDLSNYQPYWAAKAFVFRQANQKAKAIAAYDKAIALSQNVAEIRYLKNQRLLSSKD